MGAGPDGCHDYYFPDALLVGVPDPVTGTLARLLSQHDRLEVRPSATSDCNALLQSAAIWHEHLANDTKAARAEGKLVVAGCAQLWLMGPQRLAALLDELDAAHTACDGQRQAGLKVLFVLRDEPDYLYDSWNLWCWPDLDDDCEPEFRNRRPEHTRSPERFHQIVTDPELAARFPPVNTTLRWEYKMYRNLLNERLTAVSAHQLFDRPWETVYRLESFLDIGNQLSPEQVMTDVAKAKEQLEEQQQQQQPMELSTRTHLNSTWADDCRYLTEKAHLWFPSCPVVAVDGAQGSSRGSQPVLQRKQKTMHAAKLIGLLRSKKRELVRAANLFIWQHGVPNVTLGLSEQQAVADDRKH